MVNQYVCCDYSWGEEGPGEGPTGWWWLLPQLFTDETSRFIQRCQVDHHLNNDNYDDDNDSVMDDHVSC